MPDEEMNRQNERDRQAEQMEKTISWMQMTFRVVFEKSSHELAVSFQWSDRSQSCEQLRAGILAESLCSSSYYAKYRERLLATNIGMVSQLAGSRAGASLEVAFDGPVSVARSLAHVIEVESDCWTGDLCDRGLSARCEVNLPVAAGNIDRPALRHDRICFAAADTTERFD